MDNLKEVDKFPEIYKLLRLNQEERENINRPINSNGIQSVIKKLPTNKSPHPGSFTGGFYQIFKAELTHRLLKLFQKTAEGGMLPNSFHKTRITLIPKPDKDKKRKLQDFLLKILNKILANQIQQYIKRIIHHDQVGFIPGMQGWFNTHKSM